MAFMSFEPFLYIKNDLEAFRIKDLELKQGGKYSTYKLKRSPKEDLQQKELCYTSIIKNLFHENDEIALAKLDSKIIIFRNFTQNKNNFKEALSRHLLFVLLLFCASCVFGVFSFMNNFLAIDLAFFSLFFLGFILSLINLVLLQKQINILKNTNKEEFFKSMTKS